MKEQKAAAVAIDWAARRAADDAFWRATGTLSRAVAPHTGELIPPGRLPPSRDELEAAALVAFQYCESAGGDRWAWSVLLATVENFIRYDVPLPKVALTWFAGAFKRYREGQSMDAAFRVSRDGPGHREQLSQREVESTGAGLFATFHERFGLSVEEAKAKIDDFPAAVMSGESAYKSYKKLKRLVKRDHSE